MFPLCFFCKPHTIPPFFLQMNRVLCYEANSRLFFWHHPKIIASCFLSWKTGKIPVKRDERRKFSRKTSFCNIWAKNKNQVKGIIYKEGFKVHPSYSYKNPRKIQHLVVIMFPSNHYAKYDQNCDIKLTENVRTNFRPLRTQFF